MKITCNLIVRIDLGLFSPICVSLHSVFPCLCLSLCVGILCVHPFRFLSLLSFCLPLSVYHIHTHCCWYDDLVRISEMFSSQHSTLHPSASIPFTSHNTTQVAYWKYWVTGCIKYFPHPYNKTPALLVRESSSTWLLCLDGASASSPPLTVVWHKGQSLLTVAGILGRSVIWLVSPLSSDNRQIVQQGRSLSHIGRILPQYSWGCRVVSWSSFLSLNALLHTPIPRLLAWNSRHSLVEAEGAEAGGDTLTFVCPSVWWSRMVAIVLWGLWGLPQSPVLTLCWTHCSYNPFLTRTLTDSLLADLGWLLSHRSPDLPLHAT